MKDLSLLIPILCFFISCNNGDRNQSEVNIIKQYKQGYIEQKENGLKVLHLKGTAYERGFQRGMLQEDLAYVTKVNITQMMVWLDKDNPKNGLNILQDAKRNRAAVIEYTADSIAVRYSGEKDMLWTTNHFNAYPGWQGYSGINMATQYNKRAGLEDISTVEKWQESLEKNGIGNAGRYGRYQELLTGNYGNIDLDIARSIITDRYSSIQQKVLSPDEFTAWNDYPIMINAYDWTLSDSVSFYKSNTKKSLVVKSGNTSSFYASPETGDIWWAIGVPPAGYTMEYTHINLFDEISKHP